MARKRINVNEVAEIIYQWHQGKSVKGIQRSLGVDRNTVRKYVEMGQLAGVRPEEPFPRETELIQRVKGLSDGCGDRDKPAQALIAPHRDWIEGLLKDSRVTAKQIWRLLKEENPKFQLNGKENLYPITRPCHNQIAEDWKSRSSITPRCRTRPLNS